MASPLAQNPNFTDSVRVRKGSTAVSPFAAALVPQQSRCWRIGGPCFPRQRALLTRFSLLAFRSRCWGSNDWHASSSRASTLRSLRSDLEAYERKTTDELLATARLIAALYANMRNFALFKSLCLLYFAAASYSETARRLGKPHLASSFLLHDHPQFGPRSKELIERAMHISGGAETDRLMRRHPASHRADRCGRIEQTEHAQLVPRGRGRPACFLLQARINADEIESLLLRCGFHQPQHTSLTAFHSTRSAAQSQQPPEKRIGCARHNALPFLQASGSGRV